MDLKHRPQSIPGKRWEAVEFVIAEGKVWSSRLNSATGAASRLCRLQGPMHSAERGAVNVTLQRQY